MPLLLAMAGLIGSVATAELAIAADDAPSAPTRSPTLQATPASDETTTSASEGEPVGADDQVDGGEETSATDGAAIDDRSDQATGAELGADCPPLFLVFFPFASAVPHASLDSEPEALAAWMADHPDARLIVDGHADAAGSEQANLELSFRRAEATVVLLTEAGVESERIQARGFGEYQPVAGAPADDERNRRVTMQLEGRSDCRIDDKDTPE